MATKTLDNISTEIDQLYAMTEREFVALAKRMKKIEEELARIKAAQKQVPMRRP